MSEERPKRESMNIEEATISNMWEMEVLLARQSAVHTDEAIWSCL